MKTTTLVEHPSASASRAISSRCLRLAAVREEFGLSPLLFGVGEVRIGSDPQADFPLPFSGIAAEHVVIEFDGQVAIAASQHPMSWLNDGPFRRSRLKKGDRLALGPIELVIDYVEVPEPPPVPRAAFSDPFRDSRDADAVSTHNQTDDPPAEIPEAALQSLLEEANASRALREDLKRLQEEVARLRSPGPLHGVVATPAPRVARTPAELPLARGRRVPGIHRSQTPANGVQFEDATALRAVTRESEAAAQQLAARRAELELERRQLDERRTALERERSEFDSAVEALDEDRRAWSEQLRREREAQESLARQIAEDRTALDTTATELRAQSQILIAREQGLVKTESTLDQLRRELETRLQHCEEKSAEIEQLRREFDSKNGESTSAFEALRRELQIERDQLARESAQMRSVQAQAAADRAAAESLRSELRRQADEIENWRSRLAADEAAHRDALESLRAREQQLSAREDELKQAAAALESTYSPARTDEAESSAKAAEVREQLHQLAGEASRLRKAESRLQAEVEEWKSRAAALEAAAAGSTVTVTDESVMSPDSPDFSTVQAEVEWTRIRETQLQLEELRESLEVRGKQLSADRLDHERAILTLERARTELQEARTHLDRDSQTVQSREDLLADQESILESRWQELREHERRVREAERSQPDGAAQGLTHEKSNTSDTDSGVAGDSARQLTPAEMAELPLAAQIACFLGEPGPVKSPTPSMERTEAKVPPLRMPPAPPSSEREVNEVVVPSTETTEAQGDSIRSQLAALFGIPRQEIDATERRHPLLENREGDIATEVGGWSRFATSFWNDQRGERGPGRGLHGEVTRPLSATVRSSGGIYHQRGHDRPGGIGAHSPGNRRAKSRPATGNRLRRCSGSTAATSRRGRNGTDEGRTLVDAAVGQFVGPIGRSHTPFAPVGARLSGQTGAHDAGGLCHHRPADGRGVGGDRLLLAGTGQPRRHRHLRLAVAADQHDHAQDAASGASNRG
jgi:hypothetical protein